MANEFTQQRIIDSNKRALIKYVGTIDSAGANTILLDVSTLRFSLNTNGQIMTGNTNTKSNYRTTIKRIFGYAKANAYLRLQWAGDSNSTIITIGTGNFDYNFESMGDGAVINNPEANATGDILVTVVTPSTADTVTMFLDLRKDGRDFDSGQTADPAAFNRGPSRFL
jgi:hypothetical protein